ncbi:MAG TPA: acyltransferase [Steroidobacteraceae bacterium]|nr:acyltransferase [Steroidobacteraceae bacterium]
MTGGHKYQRLDSLRGLAALSVGVGHAFLCVDFSQGSSLQTAALGLFDGDYAVDLFFVLSGFVLVNMVRGFSGAHYAAYLGRRLLRLYPLLWASLIVAYVTQALVVAHAPSCADLSYWICRLITPPSSMLAAVKTAIPVDFHLDPTSWTIKVEIAVSIVYPLLLAAWMKGGIAGKIATAAACTAAIFVFSGHPLPHFVFLFLLGIAINDIRIANARMAGIMVGIGLALMAISGFFVRAHSVPADLIAGTSAALLIASVAYRCPSWLATLLDNRGVLKLGQISYAYYLLNPIVLWLLARADARSLSRLLVAGDDERAFLVASLLAVCAGLASVCLADAANRIIEKPSIAWSCAAEQGILRLLGNGLRPRAAPASR